MKREDKLNLINDLSVAVTDQTIYDQKLGKGRVEYIANTNALKINGNLKLKTDRDYEKIKETESEEEIFARIYAERKSNN